MRLMGKVRLRINSVSVKFVALCLAMVLLPVAVLMLYVTGRYRNYVRDELRRSVVRQLQNNEEDFYTTLQHMTNIVRIIGNNDEFCGYLNNPEVSGYTKQSCFDRIISDIEFNNLYSISGFRIACVDNYGKVYSNWSTNFHDYSFLNDLDWVREGIQQNGYVVWNFFEPSYIVEENKSIRYISVVQSVLNRTGGRVGTIIVSIPESVWGNSLKQACLTPEDIIYICTESGQVVLNLDHSRRFEEEQIHQFAVSAEEHPEGMMVSRADHEYLLTSFTLGKQFTYQGERLHIMCLASCDAFARSIHILSQQTGFIVAAFMLLLCLSVAVWTKVITRPLQLLSEKMLNYQQEELIEGLDFERQDEIGDINRSFRSMSITISELFRKQRTEVKERERYRYEALRAQVNPHFLFNVLNSLRWMAIIENAGNIVECIDALATILRYSMNRDGEMVSIQEEIESVEAYIFINNFRYGNRLRFQPELDEDVLKLRIIRFILQPVIENSVLHGFKNVRKEGVILLHGGTRNGVLKLYVEDNGIGFSSDWLQNANAAEGKGEKKITGIGLGNVNGRIQSEYGEAFGLRAYNSETGGAVIEYTLPVIRHDGRRETDAENTGCG